MTDQNLNELKIMECSLGPDSWKKVGAILRILEIGNPSMAHTKEVLKAVDRTLELSVDVKTEF